PDVNTDLFRRCLALPGLENRLTVISVFGARALWLREELPRAHPEVIARGREFAHLHPDGRRQAALPAERPRYHHRKWWVASAFGCQNQVPRSRVRSVRQHAAIQDSAGP
ncbi:MAG: hypothetical protein KAS36_11540, partial [Anaerolineales bacterium]|nr:hypothetical protein [Anaerolineales bacterium]